MYPDLMGAAGVQGDLGQTGVPGLPGDAVLQHGFPHPFAGAADREHPAFAAVLEQPVPQGACRRQGVVRSAGKHRPVLLDKAGGLCPALGPAVLHRIGFLALGDLSAQGRGGRRGAGKDHQAGHAGVQPVHHPHKGIRGVPVLPQGGGHALLAGQACRLFYHYQGGVLVQDVHSLPSFSKAFSFRMPAMVLPSLISPRMTIS